MSCETGAIEVQLKGESMEICVEVSGNGRDIRVKLVVIISEYFITKMDLLGKLIFLNQFEKTLQSLWCFVYCQLIVGYMLDYLILMLLEIWYVPVYC